MTLSTTNDSPELTVLAGARVLVRVDGNELTDAGSGVAVTRVEVRHELGRPGSFVVHTADLTPEGIDWLDDFTAQEGGRVEISMGWGEETGRVFAGELVGVELEVTTPPASQVALRGHDRLHRLARARRTRAYVGKRDSEIAADLASEHGLELVGDATALVHPYVMQADQTDLAFLRARARGIGHVFRVEDTRLLFGPRDLTGSPVATAELGKNLLELFIRTTVLGQVGEIEARGWDPEDQKEVVASVAHARLRSRMGGQASGPARADEGFGAEVSSAQGVAIAGKDAAVPGGTTPASPAEVAAAAAAAELESLALEHVRCEGSLLGDPSLRPGTVLTIKGLGRRFSGDYWLTRVTHSFDDDGYRTGFEGRRTAT
ncbi:MAG TPA: contractile injection system protein, VgrG/Pvc8 family [Nannocystis sp.]|jgi:phage protein D